MADDLTDTQRRILAVLGERPLTPREVADRTVGLQGNAGAAAASLRVLVRRGLATQEHYGRKGRWDLFWYRKVQHG